MIDRTRPHLATGQSQPGVESSIREPDCKVASATQATLVLTPIPHPISRLRVLPPTRGNHGSRAARVEPTTLIVSALLVMLPALPCPLLAQQWVERGPRPNTLGQVEAIANGEVSGGIHDVAPHPTDANTVYIGATNGGIWMTRNAMAASPTWTVLADDAESLSIGAIEFDPTDATNRTLLAGVGRFSSFLREGGTRIGLLRTTDAGTTWTLVDGGGTIAGLNASGVAPRGDTLVVSANAADVFANRGIWRSVDVGLNWTQVSGTAGTGLPAGASFDLVGDPTNNAVLYTNSSDGVYRSANTGATWTRISTPAINGLVAAAGNVEMAVGNSSELYVAVVTGGRLAGLFRTGDNGANWTTLDLPTTTDGGAVFGIHPGGQGNVHLSLAADPTNANTLYIGGDRQSRGAFWPNSLGANDWSGRLFRGNAAAPTGSQFVHLTHSNALGAAGGGTANGSAPPRGLTGYGVRGERSADRGRRRGDLSAHYPRR